MKHYCIVDIETTGGRGDGHRVIEIAMIKFDGEKVIDQMTTLINPERTIPQWITYLTGISSDMVESAPKFFQVAKKIVEFTNDCIFVAHNVFFDFNVLKNEFAQLGYAFKAPKLCTVRLARTFIPGHASYSLGKLCKELNIPITQRHRAMGDAEATLILFQRILSICPTPQVIAEIASAHQLALPPALNSAHVEKLPEATGVYYFFNAQEKIIYVGKSKNIKRRIRTHFRPDLKRNKDVAMKLEVANIECEITDDEVLALVLEAQEIKRLRPLYNRSMNRVKFNYQVELGQTDNFLILRACTKKADSPNLALCFRSKKVATSFIEKIYDRAFGVTPEHQSWSVMKSKLGAPLFNQRLSKILQEYEYPVDDGILIFGSAKATVKLHLHISATQAVRLSAYRGANRLKDVVIDEDPDIKRLLLKELCSRRWQLLTDD